MRIISGSFRGRRLAAPEGRGTRPILDRQKEALFNILQGHLPTRGALDLFAGSGGLGFEALSRGAEEVIFVEKDRKALQVLRRNARDLGAEERCRILDRDVLKGSYAPDFEVGLVFLDPPFPLVAKEPQAIVDLMTKLRAELSFEDDAMVCLRIPSAEPVPPTPEGFVLEDQRSWGESVMLLYAPTAGDTATG